MRISDHDMPSLLLKMILTGLIACITAPLAYANNLTISNVSFGSRDPSTKTLVISFDAAWENSWRNKINHDAVWFTVRLNNPSVSPTNKKLCSLAASGLNPSGISVGGNTALEAYVPSDKLGLFMRRSSNASTSNVTTTGVSVTVNYASCGFSDSDQVSASILGIEMVYIPQGSFYVGDNDTSSASLDQGSSDPRPWYVSSEETINVSNPTANGYRYVSANNSGEYSTGSAFSVPAAFPKGFNSFYAMKYEVTEGQWVEFINSLPTDAMRAAHDLTDNVHKGSDSVVARNTIACSGTPLVCSTTRPQRPVTCLSWRDLTAFLDWAALRPMTELEFEKIARGPVLSVKGEYAWGTTNISSAAAISGNEDGSETVSTAGANANYGNTTLSGGDAANEPENAQGALRGGIFATTNTTREGAGASYYGVMDLSGNAKEQVVTLGNAAGLSFSGSHGSSLFSTDPGFEGNAVVTGWPGMDAITSHGITSASGSGTKGGGWSDSQGVLRVSDRSNAAAVVAVAGNDTGGRGVRTYDGN